MSLSIPADDTTTLDMIAIYSFLGTYIAAQSMPWQAGLVCDAADDAWRNLRVHLLTVLVLFTIHFYQYRCCKVRVFVPLIVWLFVLWPWLSPMRVGYRGLYVSFNLAQTTWDFSYQFKHSCQICIVVLKNHYSTYVLYTIILLSLFPLILEYTITALTFAITVAVDLLTCRDLFVGEFGICFLPLHQWTSMAVGSLRTCHRSTRSFDHFLLL